MGKIHFIDNNQGMLLDNIKLDKGATFIIMVLV